MKSKITLGPLIEATMRPMDIIPALLNECFRRDISYGKVINDAGDQWPDQEIQIGRALKVVSNEILGSPGVVVTIPDHDWWNKDLDNGQGWTNHEENQQVVEDLIDLLDQGLVGCWFGVHPDDSACLGYWAALGDEDDAGNVYSWEPHYGSVLITGAEGKTVLLQGDDSLPFLKQTGEVNFIWNNDPKNEEGRVFKTLEEHLDAIAEPYFDND